MPDAFVDSRIKEAIFFRIQRVEKYAGNSHRSDRIPHPDHLDRDLQQAIITGQFILQRLLFCRVWFAVCVKYLGKRSIVKVDRGHAKSGDHPGDAPCRERATAEPKKVNLVARIVDVSEECVT